MGAQGPGSTAKKSARGAEDSGGQEGLTGVRDMQEKVHTCVGAACTYECVFVMCVPYEYRI